MCYIFIFIHFSVFFPLRLLFFTFFPLRLLLFKSVVLTLFEYFLIFLLLISSFVQPPRRCRRIPPLSRPPPPSPPPALTSAAHPGTAGRRPSFPPKVSGVLFPMWGGCYGVVAGGSGAGATPSTELQS